MIQKDDGVVLKAARSGETSRIVTFLGRRSGKVRIIAKGALKPASPFRGALEPGNHAEVLYYFKEGRTLYFLREVHVHEGIGAGRDSLARMAASLAVLELTDAVCFWESPEARVVDLAVEYLRCPPPADPRLLFLAYEARLLDVLGALPDLGSCAVCGEPTERGVYIPERGESLCAAHAASSARAATDARAAPGAHAIALDPDLAALARALAGSRLDGAARAGVPGDLRKRLGALLHWTYTFHVQNYRLPESLKLIQKE
jgi:DNA repair protein RecO (recombination protein O)